MRSHAEVEFEMDLNGESLWIIASGKILDGDCWAPHLTELSVDVFRRERDDDIEVLSTSFSLEDRKLIEAHAEVMLYGDHESRVEDAREERRHYA